MNETIDPVRAGQALTEAISAAFAEMAFIDAEPLTELPKAVPSDRAAIDVLKPLSLRLELAAGPALRGRIADILFGADTELNRDDAFLEIVNVAAGIFLSKYYGAKSEVRLELPRYLYGTDDEEGALVFEIAFDAEGESMVAALRSVRYRY